MGTNGTIAVKAGDTTLRVYNHYDSYPTWLGAQFAKFVRNTDATTIRQRVEALTLVDENAVCPEDVLETLKASGIWENVSMGNDWYAALRGAQGNFETYLLLGYAPKWEGGDDQEWGYLANFDTRTFHVTYFGEPVASLPFDAVIRWTEDQLREQMTKIENSIYNAE
ncbi:hypothetical protein QEH42_gp145 [Microbacterium phage Pumpernickel]|uniref:Uncharacterized protein n=1 Tax=Microbacterium phage Pumpernickel TaxID=2885983 RepID=A0AAE8Y7W4_9CAUD|nr:hypothetical protein QEH42_gp022 [Microbacterium phage Pumpernickel]YP_010755313.1 hypothetical protein QEH42_gp145 [Microbacterium phage Pumpernickel]UDL15813.1 hypothetical protein SEA_PUMPERNICKEL_22 [Microbacterium phage Pumpernickel]UDL16073.1 hypothetical protein SEA_PUMPERNICKEL_323 [Microbacterium phage Pumpernickel]